VVQLEIRSDTSICFGFLMLMEGPTPVSALIHAATMVTAGVFMVASLNPLYGLSDTALAVVGIIGGITSLFAATMGLVQRDMKRIIAYSTISQIGYMFIACGVVSLWCWSIPSLYSCIL